jgi:hypothetical protein
MGLGVTMIYMMRYEFKFKGTLCSLLINFC